MTLLPEPYVGYSSYRTFDALGMLERNAAERGVSMAGLALAWALAQPEVREVRAQTLPDNEASIRALLRAGFEETDGNERLRRFRRAG